MTSRALLSGLLTLVSACVEAPAVCPLPPPSSETWLGLTHAQRDSLVELTGEVAGEEAHCSGVVVAPTLLLTAQHCSTLLDDDVSSIVNASGSELAFVSVRAHDGLDLLAVTLAEPAPGIPIPRARGTLDDSVVGTHAELTGFSRGGARPWFQVEPIAELGDEHVVTDSGSARGGCAGDSGGPLLWRGPTGDIEVLGVLSDGAPGCRGRDRYVRLDATDDAFWGGLPGAAPGGCGNLPDTGRCYDGRAVWCEAGAVTAASCERCGWSTAADGFRCLSLDDVDPCEGVTDLGRCDGDDALLCERGDVVRARCPECGGGCAVDVAHHRAVCPSP